MVRAEREADFVELEMVAVGVVHIIVTTRECILSGVEGGQEIFIGGVIQYGVIFGRSYGYSKACCVQESKNNFRHPCPLSSNSLFQPQLFVPPKILEEGLLWPRIHTSNLS